MLRWFRRDRDDDDDFEEDEDAAAEAGGLADEVPEFALIVAESDVDGWHLAAVLAEGSGPGFYARAVAVRWPFVLARPAPSNRKSDRSVSRHKLSPSGSMPSRKLVVNWAWEDAGDSVMQLRFYVKRGGPRLLRRDGSVTVRVTLKESGWPRRRIVVPVTSNRVRWRSMPDDDFEADEVEKPAC